MTTRLTTARLTATLILLAMASAMCWSAEANAQLVATDLARHTNLRSQPPPPPRVAVTLTWGQPVRVQVELRRDEVIVRASAPLDHGGFATLAAQLQPWIRGLQLGYDTAVFRLKPGVRARYESQTMGVVLLLSTGDQPPPRRRFDPQAGRRRLQFLKATLLWSTGDALAAAELLSRLRRVHPDDANLLAAEAVAQTRLGRWRRATEALQSAHALQGTGGRGDLPPVGSIDAPQATIEVRDDTQSDGINRRGAGVRGHAFVAPGMRLLGRYDYAVLPSNRTQRGAIGLRQDLLSGHWLRLQIGAAKDRGTSVGGRVQTSLWDGWGRTRLDASWNEPNWALPALITMRTTRSALGIQRTLRSLTALGRPLAGNVNATISAHLERWQQNAAGVGPQSSQSAGYERVDDVFLAASLRYESWRTQPRIWASYTIIRLQLLDSSRDEAVASNAKPSDKTGQITGLGALRSLLVSSQIHSANAGLRWQVWRWLEVTGHAGYGLSIGGLNAVQLGGGVSWTPPTGLRGSLTYDRGFQPATYGIRTAQLVGRITAAF